MKRLRLAFVCMMWMSSAGNVLAQPAQRDKPTPCPVPANGAKPLLARELIELRLETVPVARVSCTLRSVLTGDELKAEATTERGFRFALKDPPQNAAVALETFKGDLAAEAFLESATVEVSALQPLFEETAARHTAKHGFRTYDILHVVSARILGCDHFFSFDAKAIALAGMEGLTVTPLRQ